MEQDFAEYNQLISAEFPNENSILQKENNMRNQYGDLLKYHERFRQDKLELKRSIVELIAKMSKV